VCEAGVREAVLNPGASDKNIVLHDMRVAYELLLDAKRHKQRIADVVLALQDSSRTPPAAGSSPRVLGLGVSPSASNRVDLGGMGSSGSPRSGEASKEVQARRRRWFLGIQSKKVRLPCSTLPLPACLTD